MRLAHHQGGKDGNATVASQGRPRISGKPPDLGRGKKPFPTTDFRGSKPCQHFDSEFLASRTLRQQNCIVVSYLTCSILLWQPQETNTLLNLLCLNKP